MAAWPHLDENAMVRSLKLFLCQMPTEVRSRPTFPSPLAIWMVFFVDFIEALPILGKFLATLMV